MCWSKRLLCLFISGFISTPTFSHPGRTSSDGCHFCRTNCLKWGHQSGKRHSHSGGACDPSKGLAEGSAAQKLTVIKGKVVGVMDGDTFEVLTENKKTHKIRVYGVDSPENGQAFGNVAKKFASDMIYMKSVEIQVIDTDRYGRHVGLVKLKNGDVLNQALISSGYAWVYHKYCKKEFCETWQEKETTAKNKKKGLWKDKKPMPPWNYRRLSKAQKASLRRTPPGQ